jgi:hypothetical protein
MKFGVIVLAAAMSAPVAVQATDVTETLAAARRQVTTADYRLSGRIVCVDGSGTRTSDGLNMKAHWFPGVLRVLVEVRSPATARVHVLLEMSPGGTTTIQIALPGVAVATVLPFDKWNTGPLGAEFSYEDFIDESSFWSGQTDMGEAKFGARNCDHLKSRPAAEDKTHYAEVKSWLDLGSGFPVYVGKALRGSEMVKEFTTSDCDRRRASGRRPRWKRKSAATAVQPCLSSITARQGRTSI